MGERVTVQEAARRLGVKDDAIRKRIQRGSLGYEKSLDGRVYVYLDSDGRSGVDERRAASSPESRDALVEALRDEVSFLRRELERKDGIILSLTRRSPGEREEATPPDGAACGVERARASWWRRLFGG